MHEMNLETRFHVYWKEIEIYQLCSKLNISRPRLRIFQMNLQEIIKSYSKINNIIKKL